MTAEQDLIESHRIVATLSHRFGQLPAVPQRNWCELVARSIRDVLPHVELVGVQIARTGEDGDSIVTEAVGAASRIDSAGSADREFALLDLLQRTTSRSGMPEGEVSFLTPLVGVIQHIKSSPQGLPFMGASSAELIVGVQAIDRTSHPCLLAVYVFASAGSARDTRLFLEITFPFLHQRAVTALGQCGASRIEWITAREQEVLSLLVLGHSVPDIARTLYRSPHTVHDHVKSLHAKLGVRTRGELVARVLGLCQRSGSHDGRSPGSDA